MLYVESCPCLISHWIEEIILCFQYIISSCVKDALAHVVKLPELTDNFL